MKIELKRLKKIIDILDIDGVVISGQYSSFEESLSKIEFSNSEISNIITRYLKKIKDSIIGDLKEGKLVKVSSSIALYTLFIPSKDNEEEFFVLSPYLESYISMEAAQEVLSKQGLSLEENLNEMIYPFTVISKKKFNHLIEMIADTEDVDYDTKIEVYKDNSIRNVKKSTIDRRYEVEEVVANQTRINGEIISALVRGDITRIMMIFDLRGYGVENEKFPIGDNARRRRLGYINDVLHAALIDSEANSVDVDALWIKVKNQLDNYDFSEDIVRKYCLLVDKERYKDKQQVVRNCILYINDHIREKISLNDVSDYLGVNKSYLSSIFNREMGFSIVDYIHDKRIANSKYLLRNTDFSISEISDYVGYYDTSYYIRIFKTLEKTTPLKYREQSSRERM